MRLARQRLRARRNKPSLERTTKASASAVKVLWPRPARSNWPRMNASVSSGPRRGSSVEIGDAGADLLVDDERERLQQGGLADQHQIVRARKILEKQAQFAQAFGLHQMRVVNDGHEHFAGAVEPEGFLDQAPFAWVIVALELDGERLAEDAQGVVIGVEGAVNHRGDDALGIEVDQGFLENGFAGARFAQDQAKAALLSVNFQDVQGLLLGIQEGDRFRVKRVALKAKVGTNHKKQG